MKNNTILEVKNLNFSYGKEDILKNINFKLKSGKILGIIGKSGCGKSTLLRVIAGFYKPTSGSITVLGKEHNRLSKNVMYINQDFNQLFPWLTVKKNIEFPLKKNHNQEKEVLKYINYVELDGKKDYYPYELSGGQKQRVVLARSLITNPDILLMDEPFNSLDITTKQKLQKTTKKVIKETNTTVIFVTHSIKEALYMSDSLLIFGKNKIYYYNNLKNVDREELSNLI